MRTKTMFIHLLVFCSGFVTLGVELSASRLVAPYFGTSLPVWSSLIGLILVALSIGYWVGGRLGDRFPSMNGLLWVVVGAGLLTLAIPLIAPPVLGATVHSIGNLEGGVLITAFVGVLILLGIPMVLFGMLSPFALRLVNPSLEETGRTAGRLFAISTLGSFLGAVVPSIWLIPAIGTRWTFIAFGTVMLLLAGVGFLLMRLRSLALVPAALVGLSVAAYAGLEQPIRASEGLVFEGESPYQYVRVQDRKSGWRVLQLNEGVVVHSKYHPERPLTFGEWDYFAVAPFFAPAPVRTEDVTDWALIGAGAGTTAKLVLRTFRQASVLGVELDPLVVEMGRRFFDMDDPAYQVEVADGRGWLRRSEKRFHVIGVDAYKQPYIPFELTTVEFFRDLEAHLTDNGVLAMNISSPPGDNRLVNALATTVSQVFPSVFLLQLPKTSMATVLVATKKPSTLAEFEANRWNIPRLLRPLLHEKRVRIRTEFEPSVILTDDKAPVERLIDLMLLDQLKRLGG